MNGKLFVLLFVGIFYGFLFWYVYVLFAHPLKFVEWFIRRTYRWWGLSVEIDDEGKLRRRTRLMGLLLLAFLIVHASVVVLAIMGSR